MFLSYSENVFPYQITLWLIELHSSMLGGKYYLDKQFCIRVGHFFGYKKVKVEAPVKTYFVVDRCCFVDEKWVAPLGLAGNGLIYEPRASARGYG